MSYLEGDSPCLMKGCNNPRRKGKWICNKHWKSRRKRKDYKFKRLDNFEQ